MPCARTTLKYNSVRLLKCTKFKMILQVLLVAEFKKL